MTTVSCNPEKLESAAKSLETLAGEAEDAKSKIDTEFANEGDPMNPDVYLSAISTACIDLGDRADSIRKCKQAIIDINDSGVGWRDDDGTITCPVPEGIELTRASDLVDWARAATDAADLKSVSGGGQATGGRSIEEIISSMKDNQDNSVYALAFVDSMGAGTMLDVVIETEEKNRPEPHESLVSALSNVTATATHSNPSIADDMYSAVTENEHQGRITALNLILSEPEVEFGTEFLIDLATELETVDYLWDDYIMDVEADSDSITRYANHLKGPALEEETSDPLSGVLHAMGYNEDAALAYLAPETDSAADSEWGPSGDATARWELLRSRGWDERSWEGLAAALGGASSMRPPSDTTNDERATWITAQGVTLLADEDKSPGLTDRAKSYVGVLLGNSGPELTGIAAGGTIVPQSSEPYRTTPITIAGGDAEALETSFAQLMYDVSDNPDANYNIARGATAYSAYRAYARDTDGTPASIEDIQGVYNDGANVLALQEMLAQDRVDEGNAAIESIHKGATAASSLLALYPPAAPLSTLAGAALTLADSTPIPDANEHYGGESVLGAAYTNAFNAGHINTPPNPAENPWYSQDAEGNVSITLDTDEQIKSFYDWITAGAGNSSEVKTAFDEIGRDGASSRIPDAEAFKREYLD